MIFKLTATLTHQSFGDPVLKEMIYDAESFEGILKQIEEDAHCPPYLMLGLKQHRRTAFKDIRGVKHSWKLAQVE